MKEPVIQKLDFSGDADHLARGPLEHAHPEGSDHARRPQDQAPPREHRRASARSSSSAPPSARSPSNLDPARLDALGMGVDEVDRRPAVGERQHPARPPDAGRHRDAAARLGQARATSTEFPAMVIGHRGTGEPITAGRRRRRRRRRRGAARRSRWINGEPAVALDITKQTKANTVDVVDAVKKAIAELAAGAARRAPRSRSSATARSSSASPWTTSRRRWCSAASSPIVIVFCFLNSWRSTVITGLTLPISVISSFIVMYFLGMTLNMMTLMALSLAIGLLIDDAIVVRENIVRHLEHGAGPLRRRPATAPRRSASPCSRPRCRSSRSSCRWRS